ncbi:epithelial cell adhesion molecule precursor [Silurus asotus]|uniref:Epithelial cell adhesion molecule n=1 Tax=Silurus asotus TaxID=30991 RepID=A0AAD5FNC0_SILAS|nr:epithelial cell adhesion molecule precursor [Silurus asotus]
MKAEIDHLRHFPLSESNVTTLSVGDVLYDPECEPNGLFKAKQCKSSEVCWCVDGAGVRRSHYGDRNLRCEELVGPNWVRIMMKSKETIPPLELSQVQRAIASAIQDQDNGDPNMDSKIKVKYDVDARLITLEVRKNADDHTQDLSLLNYYIEKDAVVQSLFNDQMNFEPTIESEKLELESIMVYYVEEKEPANGIKPLTIGLLTVTCVFILTACVGLLILFLIRRQKKAQYEKAQVRLLVLLFVDIL